MIFILLLITMASSLVTLVPYQILKFLKDPQGFMRFGQFCWFIYLFLLSRRKLNIFNETAFYFIYKGNFILFLIKNIKWFKFNKITNCQHPKQIPKNNKKLNKDFKKRVVLSSALIVWLQAIG